MQLKQFIAETLVEICEGVVDAQARGKELGADVNPHLSGGNVRRIEFDVEVTTSEGTATKSGLGVFVGAVGAGTQGKSQSAKGSVGRIKFDVPLVLPYSNAKR